MPVSEEIMCLAVAKLVNSVSFQIDATVYYEENFKENIFI